MSGQFGYLKFSLCAQAAKAHRFWLALTNTVNEETSQCIGIPQLNHDLF